MTRPFHHDMRNGKDHTSEGSGDLHAQGVRDVVDANSAAAENHDDGSEHSDAPDTLATSTQLSQKLLGHASFLDQPALDVPVAQPPEERSKSAPPVHRSQPYSILQSSIESFQRRSIRLDAVREEAFRLRMELKFLRNNYRQQHKFVDESQRSLNDHVELMVKTDDFVTTRSDLLFRYGLARGDYLGLADQSGKLQGLEDHLTRLENSMKRLEKQLNQTSERILGLLRHLDPATRGEGEPQDLPIPVAETTDQFSSSEGSDRISEASLHEHPLLEEYFDKAGDVKVAKGRLMELLKEHEDRHTRRNLQEDQGIVLDISEADFKRACAVERNNGEQAIRNAIVLRNKAKADCLAVNIDPDQHRHTTDALDGILERSIEVDGLSEGEVAPTRYFSNYNPETGPAVVFTKTGSGGEAVTVDEEEAPFIAESVERWIDTIHENQINPLLDQVAAEENTRTSISPPRILRYRRELTQYLIQHGSAAVIARLANYGIELPLSTKQDIDRMATYAKSTLSDTSRSSSESRLSALLRSNIPHDDLIADISEAARGRRR